MKLQRLCVLAAAGLGILCSGSAMSSAAGDPVVSSPPTSANAELTDAQLVAYAQQPFDKKIMSNQTVTVGQYHGQSVVSDVLCGDVCPGGVRTISFQLKPNTRCESVGGELRAVTIMEGAVSQEAPLCFPKVLVDRNLYYFP